MPCSAWTTGSLAACRICPSDGLGQGLQPGSWEEGEKRSYGEGSRATNEGPGNFSSKYGFLMALLMESVFQTEVRSYQKPTGRDRLSDMCSSHGPKIKFC